MLPAKEHRIPNSRITIVEHGLPAGVFTFITNSGLPNLDKDMQTPEHPLPVGSLVSVSDCHGVIIEWPGTNEIPEDHYYAVWYGETSTKNSPRCRVVPMEYCVPVTKIEYYH